MITIQYGYNQEKDISYIKVLGHAENNLICNAATAIIECLAANLIVMNGVAVDRKDESGDYLLEWRSKNALSDYAASFATIGLIALAEEYPENLQIQKGEKTHDYP